MSDIVLVTGVIDLDPTNRDAAIAALNEVMAATRQEDGCEHYCFSADLTDPGRFHLSEQWTSVDHLNAHLGSPHIAAMFGKMGEFGVTGTSITKWHGATSEKLM